MSATITRETPSGLDAFSPEELAAIADMSDDAPGDDGSIAAPEPAAPAAPTAEDLEIDVPEAPAAAVAPERSRTVPQQALHQEREKRRAAEKKALERETELAAEKAARAQDQAVLQARVDMIAKLAETQAAVPVAPVAEEALPDKTTDPIGYFEALTGRMQKRLEAQDGMLRGFAEQQRRAQQGAELRAWGMAQENEFAEREPDYSDAMEFLKASRRAELRALGVTDAAERERTIAQDVNTIALVARRDGANFAERLFKTAQERGFVKKAAAPAVPAAPAIPALDAEFSSAAARAERGRENAMTLSTVGSAPAAKLSVERIANMSESEFDALITKAKTNPGAYPEFIRQLMGA